MGYRVAIVGATGLVGHEFVKVLEQRNFPVNSIKLLASEHSVGKNMLFANQNIQVEETTTDSFRDVDIAFFSAGADVSRYYSPVAAKAGALVIDNSSAFRMDPGVPLVVPEINAEDIQLHQGIIANPNCATIQMVVALYPLHRVNPVKRVVITTLQAVSGTGTAAMEELTTQTKQVLNGQVAVPHIYPHQIAFNLIPEIDVFFDNGYTKEEWKLIEETRKIMHAPGILVAATCVRVPVFIGHSEVVNVEFSEPMPLDTARQVLVKAPGVKILDDPSVSLYPQPWSVSGSDDVFVGRIRQDTSSVNGLVFWIVADNLRKGAALNAVQIAEEADRRGWVNPERRCA